MLISGAINFTSSELTDKEGSVFLQKPFPLESLEKMIIDCVLYIRRDDIIIRMNDETI
jgi:hypothetical protein